MKKILTLLAVISFFASCSNDDITVSYETFIEVVPKTVVSSFVPWQDTDDLAFFNTDYKLRTRILVYNTENKLVFEDSTYLSSYTEIMRTSPSLPIGNYKIIAVTDIIKYTNNKISFRYWDLKNKENLTGLEFSDAGYIGGQYKFLGIKTSVFNVDGQNKTNLRMEVKPAGALVVYRYEDIHEYSSIKELALLQNTSGSGIKINPDNLTLINEYKTTSGGGFFLDRLDLSDYSNYRAIYGYVFCLPGTFNINFQYSEGSSWKDIHAPWRINIETGKEYFFQLDLKDEEEDISAFWMEIPTNSNVKRKSVPQTFVKTDDAANKIRIAQ